MGYNAVTTAFSKYAQGYWGLEGGLFAYSLIVAQAAAILSYIPVGMVASRVGRKKTILFGVALLAFAFGSAIFFKTFTTALFFFFALAGIGWASINVNSYPMVVEISKASDVGKYTGIYYTFSMSAQIATPILSGALLQYVGYWTLFPYGTFFVAASFVTMLLVKHGDNKPVPLKKQAEASGSDV
jgi:MFS family permease